MSIGNSDIGYLSQTITLLRSMILCGKAFTDKSAEQVKTALILLDCEYHRSVAERLPPEGMVVSAYYYSAIFREQSLIAVYENGLFTAGSSGVLRDVHEWSPLHPNMQTEEVRQQYRLKVS